MPTEQPAPEEDKGVVDCERLPRPPSRGLGHTKGQLMEKAGKDGP